MEQAYAEFGKENQVTALNGAMGLDEKLSRRIFATDLGSLVNGLAYFSSTIFMEEVCIFTVILLHFTLFKGRFNITLAYMACFVANLLVALVAKKLIAKPRPLIEEIPETSKSLFFRKK
jgi:hypothetical protein